MFKDAVYVCPVTGLRRARPGAVNIRDAALCRGTDAAVRDCARARGPASVKNHPDFFHPPTLLIGFPLEVDGGSPAGCRI